MAENVPWLDGQLEFIWDHFNPWRFIVTGRLAARPHGGVFRDAVSPAGKGPPARRSSSRGGMSQNRSHAVMAQRVEPHDSLEDFPTPPWATRALFEHVLRGMVHLGNSAWEPCCNRGYMAKPMASYFPRVYATDIFNYGWEGQHDVCDFLFHGAGPEEQPDWIIANPPFRLGAQFIARAGKVARIGFAMFVRTAFLEGGDRYRAIFRDAPPTIVAPFVERVIIHKGILRDPSKSYWNPLGKDKKTGKKTGTWQKPSTATSYCWLVWVPGKDRVPTMWIPPSRKGLERPGDYA